MSGNGLDDGGDDPGERFRAAQHGGPQRLELGSRFGMDMRLGAATARAPPLISISPFPNKNEEGIDRGLRRLTEMFGD